MTQQFYKLTLSEAIAQYKCSLISSTALLYYYLRIRLAPGWKMTLHQQEISQQLGISKAAFYKGIQRLKDKKLIDWEAPNGLVVRLGQIGDYEDKSETVGQIGDYEDRLKTPLDKSETLLDRSETLTPSKPSSTKHSNPSSDSYQIFINSLSDSEREKFKAFCQRKASEMPEKVVLLDSWMAKHFDELFSLYRNVYPEKKNSAAPVVQQIAEELHPAIAQGLKDGRITKLDPCYKGLWTASHGWMPQSEWLEMFGSELVEWK